MKDIDNFICLCNECNHEFQAPSLSDFVYGEFLLNSTSGFFRYLDVFEDPTLNELDSIINDLDLLFDPQKVYGSLVCDKDSNGKTFHMNMTFCPRCGSDHIDFLEKNGAIKVVSVEHKSWDALTLEEKRKIVSSKGVL